MCVCACVVSYDVEWSDVTFSDKHLKMFQIEIEVVSLACLVQNYIFYDVILFIVAHIGIFYVEII